MSFGLTLSSFCGGWGWLGTEKVPQRNCVTKILPNVRVNFLVQFAPKPLFYWIMTSNALELFRKFFGIVRAIVWLCLEAPKGHPSKGHRKGNKILVKF